MIVPMKDLVGFGVMMPNDLRDDEIHPRIGAKREGLGRQQSLVADIALQRNHEGFQGRLGPRPRVQPALCGAFKMFKAGPRTGLGRRAQPAHRSVIKTIGRIAPGLRRAVGSAHPAVDPRDFRQRAQLGLVEELKQLVLGTMLRRIGHPRQRQEDHR